jgi:hypothetical protein
MTLGSPVAEASRQLAPNPHGDVGNALNESDSGLKGSRRHTAGLGIA